MIFDSQAELKERIETLTNRKVYGRVQIFEDTTSYMSIHGGTVLRLEKDDYFIMGDTKEGRFGIDDQPKFWVKYAVDLESGADKIIKLVFNEQFTTTLGPVTVRCRRSPQKESDFLELVRGRPRFMQGRTVSDPKGNPVRVIDFIRGKSLFNYIAELRLPHEQYYHELLPDLIRELTFCIEEMHWVHQQGQHHGDIRNDHLLMNGNEARFVWIDFDYDVNFLDYDVWSMGNIINYAVGRGITTFRSVIQEPERYPAKSPLFDEHDAVALYKYRVANLAKVYPYISRDINDILMRFSAGSIDFYEDLGAQARDLRQAFGL